MVPCKWRRLQTTSTSIGMNHYQRAMRTIDINTISGWSQKSRATWWGRGTLFPIEPEHQSNEEQYTKYFAVRCTMSKMHVHRFFTESISTESLRASFLQSRLRVWHDRSALERKCVVKVNLWLLLLWQLKGILLWQSKGTSLGVIFGADIGPVTKHLVQGIGIEGE